MSEHTSREVTAGEATVPVVVAGKHRDGDAVAVLTLRRADHGPLPAWEPGAHIDVLLTNGLTRQYSLCGDPDDHDGWRIAVLREPAPRGRGGSAYVHDFLDVGTRLEVRGPRNHFPLRDADSYLFLAGGIGITPLLPMIRTVAARGADWRLAYGGRARSTMAFRAELERYGDRVRFFAEDEAGRLDLDRLLGTPVPGRQVYCCGPASLLDAVEKKCAGWDPGALHMERFAPGALAPASPDEGFEVRLAQSGLSLSVPPDRSILDVLEENGITLLSSCRAGVCGTCETAVLDGAPEHRDSVLTPEERQANASMMVCVSRCSGGGLVLDL